MTKREFDRETQENWCCDGMASDERRAYRARRMRVLDRERDYIRSRAARMRELRRMRDNWEKTLATLDRGSPFRAPIAYRARVGQTLLFGRTYW